MRTDTFSPELDFNTEEFLRDRDAIDPSWKIDRDPGGNEANENDEGGEGYDFRDSEGGEQDEELSPEEAMVQQGRAKAVEEMGGEAHEWEVGAHCNFNAAVIREGKMYEGGKDSAEIAEEHDNLENHELMLSHLLNYPDEGYRGPEYMEVTPDGTICHVSIAFVDSLGNVSHVHLFRNMPEESREFDYSEDDAGEAVESEDYGEDVKGFVEEESEEDIPVSEVQSEEINEATNIFSEMFKFETSENNVQQADIHEGVVVEDAVTVEQIHIVEEQKQELVMMELAEKAPVLEEQTNEIIDTGTAGGNEPPEIVSETSENTFDYVETESIEDVSPPQETVSQVNEIPTAIIAPASKVVETSLPEADTNKDIVEVPVPIINHEDIKVAEDVVVSTLNEESFVQEVQIPDTEVTITESLVTSAMESFESSATGVEDAASELEKVSEIEDMYLGSESIPEAQVEQQDNLINETEEETVGELGEEIIPQEEHKTLDNEKLEEESTQPQQIELHDTLHELFATNIFNDSLETSRAPSEPQENARRETLSGIEKAPVSLDVEERSVLGEKSLPSEVARILGRGTNARSVATSRFAANDVDSGNSPQAQIVVRNGIRMERAIAA